MSKIVELRRAVGFENECDIEDIVALTELMIVMLAQPDAKTALDGMQRLMGIVADRARDLRARLLEDRR
ncbi:MULTISPECIES: hypothetical protein [unclassified Bradyrhizobium]|uniref:hypothetical protein n=1 Tax=unclassified Bradyrhizobium TaxID=2631580 RepID=UPI002478652F|nr:MULTISPECIES: hypothetical protein [unclassified Bradyrhizobium]WGS23385.1 hypothetical protein MTX22_18220 [Bradyrhizobium sp. ISRA463]WGS30398.1 hypothetical protein MTX19_15945 [Bradyrhizobium sp. ISRA464]